MNHDAATIVVTAAATSVAVALAANILWGWWQGSDPVLVQRLSNLEQAHQETASAVTIMKDTVGTLVGDSLSMDFGEEFDIEIFTKRK